MRLLWLSHNVPYPPVAGVLQRNYHLLCQASRIAEVHLVALRQRSLCPDETMLAAARAALGKVCASVRILPLAWDESHLARLRLAAQAIVGIDYYDALRFYSPEAHQVLAAGLGPEFDIIHIDTLGLIPYARHVRGRATVLNHHNIESRMMARRAAQARNPLARLFFSTHAQLLKTAEVDAGRMVRRHLVVSELDAVRLRQIIPDNEFSVIANGVDTAYFDRETCVDADSRRIVFVGTQSWYPNRDAVVHFLKHIWPKIKAREPAAEFVMIGRNPCAEAQQAARRDPQVRALGFVDDLRDEVARSAVFILPFRDGGGTRLKLLDALAMRAPVVTTKMGAEGVSVEGGVHCLIAEEPEEFCDAIVRLFHDPPLRKRLADAGRVLVESQYDWSVIGAQLEQTYREVLADAATRSAKQ